MKPLEMTYLASAYTNLPDKEMAYRVACEGVTTLASLGFAVFSPIAQWHPIARGTPLEEKDFHFWEAQNLGVLAKADSLTLFSTHHLRISLGMQNELRFARERGIPTYLLLPNGRELYFD